MMPQPSQPRWQSSARTFLTVLFHELPGLVALNLVFLLSSLLVLTLGPALAALNRTADDVLRYRCSHPVRTYLSYFKARFPAALGWGVLLLFLCTVLGFAFLYYSILFSRDPLFLPLGMLALLGLLAVFGVGIHFLPALTASAAPGRELLRAAARTAVVRLPGTLAAALSSLLFLAAMVLTFPVSTPLALCLGGSLPALAASLARRSPSGAEKT